MVGWHHWLDGNELEQTLGVGDGQGSLVCCSPGSQRVGHDWATELNWTNMSRRYTFLMIWMWSSRSPTASHLQCNDNKQVHRSRRDKTKAQISQHHSQTPTSLSSRVVLPRPSRDVTHCVLFLFSALLSFPLVIKKKSHLQQNGWIYMVLCQAK